MEAAQLKQNGQVKKVVVTGCLAQRYADELAGAHLLVLPEQCQWYYLNYPWASESTAFPIC